MNFQLLTFLSVLSTAMAQDGPGVNPFPWMSAFDFSIVADDIPTPIENREPGNKPEFIDEDPPPVPKPRPIDGFVYYCSLCNPLKIRYQRQVNLIIEDIL